MNNVTLVGNLVDDPRLQDFDGTDKDGAAITRTRCSFKLAVDRNGKDAGADFIWVSVWNGSAKACADHLSKGSQVAVSGSIRTNYDKAKDRDYTEVVANPGFGVKFLNTRNGSAPLPPEADVGAAASSEAEPAEAKSDDDIPF